MNPKILFIDIETAPDVVWTWGVYQQNAIAVKEHWYVLSFAAQWREAGTVFVKGLCDYKGYKGGNSTEKQILADIHDLLNEADIVVAHNGADFDVKKLNARFIAHGFQPPSPFRVVDTKRDLTKIAGFSSNRLNWLSKQMNLGRKTMEHQDWKMWENCMNGMASAWRDMKRYNKHDVVLLRKLYERLAPWLEQPNSALWTGNATCSNPACGSRKLIRKGVYHSKTREYQRFQCKDCGSWTRAARSSRSMTTVGTPRRFS
jgi:hypothetical protein